MAFTAEQQQKILEALNPKLLACSACGKPKTWHLVPSGLYLLPLLPKSLSTGLPSVVFVCTNCGNTQLHNVFVLGLGKVLGVEPLDEEEDKNAANPSF